ncbi:MAG: hypothetical protein K1X56_07010 [Flavobacteriales bacterium]|nr:hypothetical protein [Flavobacteriales bacterium]
MKRLLLLIACGWVGTLHAQQEYSSFTATGRGGATTFVTDYQAVGINPANVGLQNQYGKKMAMGFSEMTFSLHSEALTKQDLRDNLSAWIRGDSTNNFTQAEKINAAKSFTDAGFAINADVGGFGFSYCDPKIGGIAFRMSDRFQWYSKLGQQASEMLFLGFNAPYFDSLLYNNGIDTVTIANNPNMSQDSIDNVVLGFTNAPKMISQLLDGTVMTMSWTREYNLSYGRKLFGNDSTFAIYAGAGIKYYQGMAYLDVNAEGGQLNAFSSISPAFNIDYGTAASSNPSTVTQTGKFPKPVGMGFGFDLGVNILIKNKIKIGAAITNIGSMTWDGNVYTMRDTLIYDTDNPGANNYNIVGQLSDLSGDKGLFAWQGVEKRKVNLPTTVRFGASMKIGKIAELGFDCIVPTNTEAGSFQKAIIGFGGDITPVKWVRLSAGFMTGGNYDFSVPLGITFIAQDGRWEGGIASRDVVTFFTQNGPTISFSVGFLRFRF